jgi:hypothetical protein
VTALRDLQAGRGFSRRVFLKSAVEAAGGAVVAGVALGRYVHAAGSDALKLGLVGCGGRGAGAVGNALTADPPVRAWGSGGRQVRSEITLGQIFDHHCVVYEYANGTRLYSHCRRQARCADDISDIFLGAKGTCDLMKHRIEGENPWRYQGPKANMFVTEHEALFDSIRRGQPLNHGVYMARSTMLAILGRMTTYTGQAITREQAMQSKEDLSPARYAWDAAPPVLPDRDGGYPIAVPGVTKFV